MQPFSRSIVETVRHPLIVLDAALLILRANPAFYRTFGIPEGKAEGLPIDGLNVLRDFTRLRPLLEAVLPGSGFEGVECEHESPAFGHKVVKLSARSVAHDDGTPVILLSVEDVTEPVRARDLLRRLNDELEARVRERTAQLETANRELEAFCFSVSHDLRAPLRALDGFSDELLRTYPGRVLDSRGEHYLRRVRAGSQRMGQLIDDLLRLSRLSRVEMRTEWVDLSALAGEVVAELGRREPGRRVAAVIEPDLAAAGDGGLLRVAVENLLGNAWKFTSSNPAATVVVGRCEHRGEPAFFVQDDGAGFDMAHAGRLFGAFQRLHAEREFPGNGVGLATVQRVVHRHGGRVWAEAAPGRGATFYFTLPAAEPVR